MEPYGPTTFRANRRGRARERRLPVLPDRRAARRPRGGPNPPDRGGAARGPPVRRRELRGDERLRIPRLRDDGDAVRRPRDRRGPGRVHDRRGRVRRPSVGGVAGQPPPDRPNVRGAPVAGPRHLGGRDEGRRGRGGGADELPWTPGGQGDDAVSERAPGGRRSVGRGIIPGRDDGPSAAWSDRTSPPGRSGSRSSGTRAPSGSGRGSSCPARR